MSDDADYGLQMRTFHRRNVTTVDWNPAAGPKKLGWGPKKEQARIEAESKEAYLKHCKRTGEKPTAAGLREFAQERHFAG